MHTQRLTITKISERRGHCVSSGLFNRGSLQAYSRALESVANELSDRQLPIPRRHRYLEANLASDSVSAYNDAEFTHQQ